MGKRNGTVVSKQPLTLFFPELWESAGAELWDQKYRKVRVIFFLLLPRVVWQPFLGVNQLFLITLLARRFYLQMLNMIL